jgi:MFS family permease
MDGIVFHQRRSTLFFWCTVAWLPFAALAGTVVGSVAWGVLADVYGRRASIVLSAVMFVGTSICGAMPDFWWNVGMCFMMGAAAGGMLPVAYALLAEIMPTRHRGWSLAPSSISRTASQAAQRRDRRATQLNPGAAAASC